MKPGTPRPPEIRRPIAIILLILAYVVTGWLGLQLALPPGYVSAVFPPAGICLAVLLLYGRQLWPGVLLGSLALNTLVAGLEHTLDLTALLLALAIALGSTLQCLAGCWLVKRLLNSNNFLEGNDRVIRMLLLGGPLACLIASTVGSLALVLSGQLGWGSVPYSMWSWWVGDTIGVFLFTPLTLVLLQLHTGDGRRQLLTVILPSLSMLTLVVALFFQSNNWERQRLESAFHSQARTVAENLKHDIDRYQDAVAEVRRLYESSSQVTLREFQHFTAELLERSPGIRALEFVPLVHDADRLSFERRAQAEGLSGFSIREFHRDGTIGPAHRRPEYYPVYQLAPLEGNEMALGLDMGSDSSRRTAMEQARTTRRSTATPGIVIVNTRQLGVLLFSPVFITPGSNNDVFRGVAMAALDLKNVVELGVPEAVANDVLINLIDVTTPDSPQPLYTDTREPPRETLMEWRIPLRFANRDWQLHLQASTAFLNEQRSLISWLVLAGGLLLTGILQILLLMMASHTRSV